MMNQLSQQGQSFEFDVLVIGSGIAGFSYCLQLLKLQPNIKIALISKAEVNESNSRYAQGGIAAAMAATRTGRRMCGWRCSMRMYRRTSCMKRRC